MGEEHESRYEQTYCVITRSLKEFVTQRVYRNMDLNIQRAFVKRLRRINDDVSVQKEDAHTIKCLTSLGVAYVHACPKGGVKFLIERDQDSAYPEWRAGLLALEALCAASRFMHPFLLSLELPDGREARDLVAVEVNALSGGEKKSLRNGLIPLHYANGRIINKSLERVVDLEQRLIDEASFADGKGGGMQVKYETRVAYAWHARHGRLPGFGSGRLPRGLEQYVLRNTCVPVRASTSES